MYKYTLACLLLCVCYLSGHATGEECLPDEFVSVTINGPSTVYTNQTRTYSVSVSGGSIMGSGWSVGGGIRVSYTLTSVRAKWTTTGTKSVSVSVIVNGDEYSRVKTVTVYNQLFPGSISLPVTSACNSVNPGLIQSMGDASGGSGSFAYQWQKKTNGVDNDFVDISGATSKSYDPPYIINHTTSYRRKVTSGVQVSYTNVVTVDLTPGLHGGSIVYNGAQPCMGENLTTPIQSASPPAGGTGSYIYTWERWNGTSWIPYANSNSESFLPPHPINEDLRIRRKVVSGNCEEVSGYRTIYINRVPPTPGALSISTSKLCHGQETTLGFTPYDQTIAENLAYLEVQRAGSWTELRAIDTEMLIVPFKGDNYRVRYEHSCQIVYSTAFVPDFTDFCASLDRNYIHYTTPNQPVKTTAELYALTVDNKKATIEYYDGLNRMFQNVEAHGSPQKYDVVTPIEYDQMGRMAYDYLPYVDGSRSGAFNLDAVTEQLNYTSYLGETPYTERRYEPSQRGRVEEESMPGYQMSNGHTKTWSYTFNTASEVLNWTVDNDVLTVHGYYAPETLKKSTAFDEDDHQSIEYVDKQGRVILRKVLAAPNTWAETYYVYDRFGLRRYVLPPEAVKEIGTPAFPYTPGSDLLDHWAFSNTYDHRNRTVEEKVPGKAPVYMVYDQRDRLVLTQDGNRRAKSEWLFTKYDALNRPVATGIYANVADRATMQQQLDDTYNKEIQWQPSGPVTDQDGILTRTGGSGWGSAGAATSTFLAAGENGFVGMEATETNTHRMFGLSASSPDDHFNTIDFAIYLSADGSLRVYESGISMGIFGSYSTGDVFLVLREGDAIRYLRNGREFHRSTATSTGALVGDVSIYSNGATLKSWEPSFYESSGDAVFSYTSQSFPIDSEEEDYLTVTYYDDYDFHHASLAAYAYQPTEPEPLAFDKVKGQVTGTMVRILNTDQWLRTVNYYDDRYRLIQQVGDNHKEGIDRVTNAYDFVDKIVETKTTHHTPEPILWRNLKNVKRSGNSFTSVMSGWVAGMSTLNTLEQGQDGWVSTVVTETTGHRYFGFNDEDLSTSQAEIDYAVYLNNNTIRLYYQGTYISQVGTISMGDELKLSRENGDVKLYQNEVLLHTYATTSTGPMVLDVSLFTDATLSGLDCSFSVPVDDGYPYEVMWTGLTNMSAKQDSLIKNNSNNWNGNASSLNKLKKGQNGWVTFKSVSNDKALMIGFAEKDINTAYNFINYALYLRADGILSVYEMGVPVANFHAYQPQDDFKVERTGTQIVYWHNNQVLHTSTVPSQTDLIIDASFLNVGGALSEVNSSFRYQHPQETNIDVTINYEYDHVDRLTHTRHEVAASVHWVDREHLIQSLDGSYNSSSSTGWNSGAASKEGIPQERNGYVTFVANSTSTLRMIGLSTTNDDAHWNSIDYAIFLSGNAVEIRESGSGNLLAAGQTFQSGDEFKIERKDGMIYYWHQDNLLRSSPVSQDALYADVSIFTPGHYLEDVKLSQGKMLLAHNSYNEISELVEKNLHSEPGQSTFAQSIDYYYDVKGWLTHINNASLTSTSINEDTNQPKDFWGMELGYHTPLTGVSTTASYSGNISAVKWSDQLGQKTRAYAYGYDGMDRLIHADHRVVGQANAGAFDVSIGDAMTPGYDLNGNILHLTRHGKSSAIDQLTYSYGTQGNKLQRVEDAITGDQGFINGHTGVAGNEDYAYDANANMVRDLNKDINFIDYNYLNLPDSIAKADGSYLKYLYDASGTKLAMEVYDASGTLTKTTDYVGSFIYEDGVVALIRHEEGRIVFDAVTEVPEYQYYLKDHLGNTRVTFTTKPKTHTFFTNYEGTTDDDQSLFEDVTTISNDIFDHTDQLGTTYTNAQLLNGTEGSRVGSVIAIPVGMGDTLNAKVYAKYVEVTANPTGAVTSLATSIINAFTGGIGGTHELGNQSINNNFGSGSLIGTPGFAPHDANAPMAFLNMMFLPEGELIDLDSAVTFAYDQLSSTASQPVGQPKNTNYDELRVDNFVAPGPGYVLVYLSNESSTLAEVYFDDLEIEVKEHPVIEKSDYYPFGLRQSGCYQRVTAKENKYNTFQGQERIEDLDLNWVQFKWRNHDPAIGRFFNIDPLAESFYYNSPYAFSENQVVAHIELEGLEKVPINGDGIARAFVTKVNQINDKIEQGLNAIGSGVATAWNALDLTKTFGRESTTEQALGGGVDIQGENAGPDSEFVQTADPNAENTIMEKGFLDALGAGSKSLTAPSPGGDVGDIAKTVANGINKSVKAIKTGEKVFSSNEEALPRIDTVNVTTTNVSEDGNVTEVMNRVIVIDRETNDSTVIGSN